jgi:SAM-dependent methyltransferase
MSGTSNGVDGVRAYAGIEVPLAPAAAFAAVVDELVGSLDRLGLSFEPGPGGRIAERGADVATVQAWEPGVRIVLAWRPPRWAPETATEVEVSFTAVDGATRVRLEHRGWGRVLGDGGDVAGWFAGQVAAPLLSAMAPIALGDWLTDRRARRPSGPAARETYRNPIYHYPNFRVILAELALTPADHLVEVGCGGGALLKEALRSGCRAAAVDHSRDMVSLATEVNRDAVAAGRLEVRHADAAALPFADGTFTCATMTGVLGFLPDPVAALREIRRVLRPGGRFVGMGTDPEWRGTPAAPEPMASRLRFYDGDELAQLAHDAGFATFRVVRRELARFARESGVPEEYLPLFAGPGARFLLAARA